MNSFLLRPAKMLVLLVLLLAGGSMLAQPQISYMIPDIGTTRFGTYVELIGPSNITGNFGPDGLYLNNPGGPIVVRCVRPADSTNVKIGPVVVSWDGRLISTIIFVSPSLIPNSDAWRLLNAPYRIPIEVVVNGVVSIADTFYVVKPYAFGDKRSDPARVIGEGSLGARSRRGAMLVDSMYFAGNAKYTVSLNDCDTDTPGNQANLPFVLLSKGNITGQGGTEIRLDAIDADGGPGGGGGGGGVANFNIDGERGTVGGNGYTGGGPGAFNNGGIPLAPPNSKRKPGIGSGEDLPESLANIIGGKSLNGTRGGGSTTAFENAGGGTGHPFGVSGEGCSDRNSCNSPGGAGGGSGSQEFMRGGGGGYGEDGGNENLQLQNGGKANGSASIIPLAGGSGGASGNPGLGRTYSSRGGGGGGAISIHGLRLASFDIWARGASASIRDVAAGAGSGGGVILGMRNDNSAFGPLGIQISSVTSTGFLPGGRGRTRYDARVASPPNAYTGPMTDTMTATLRKVVMTGNGNGQDIQIFIKGEKSSWISATTLTNYGGFWRANFTLAGTDTLFYVAVGQKIPNPSTGSTVHDPDWVLSQSAWNILRLFGPPIIVAPSTVNLGTFKCPGEPLRKTIFIKNDGESPLEISSATFAGDPGFRIASPTVFPDTVKGQDSNAYVIEFLPIPGQTGAQVGTVSLLNNDTVAARNPFIITLNANVRTVALEYGWRGIRGDTLNVGTICLGVPLIDELTLKNVGSDPVTLTRYVSADQSTLIVSANLPATIAVSLSRNMFINVLARKLGDIVTPTLMYVDGCVSPDTLWIRYKGVSSRMTVVGTAQFGTVAVGSSRQLAVEITNDGTSDLDIPFLNPIVAPFRLVSAVPAIPAIIQPGNSLVLTLEYAPTATGLRTDVARVLSVINGASCGDSVDIVMAGRGEVIDLVSNPTSLDFGPTRVCDLSVDTVFVENKGSTNVTLKYPAFLNGLNSTDFAISSQPLADTTLQPGGSARYIVSFRPTGGTNGIRNAELAVRTETASIPQVTVPLIGVRTSINITGPVVVSLGVIPIGSPTTTTQKYTNGTAQNVTVSAITSSRPTVTNATPTSFTFASGATQDIDITVTPTGVGSFEDTLRIVTADPCADAVVVLVRYTSESGSAGGPSAVSFGILSNCETRRDSISYSNNGTVAIDLLDLKITGVDAALFLIQNPGAVTNITLNPDEVATVFILFDPRLSPDGFKTARATQRIRINNTPIDFVTELSGSRLTSIPSAPNVIVFGEVDVNAASDQLLSLVNTGTSDVRITAIRLRGTAGGVFTLTNANLPFTLAPQQRADVQVRFTPTDRRDYLDTILVEFDQPCSDTRLIPVSGRGRLNVEILVAMPKLIIHPAEDNGELVVNASIVTGTSELVTASLRMVFRYTSSLFVVQGISKGTIIRNEVVAGVTEVEVDVPDVELSPSDAPIFSMFGQATIGPVDSTDLDITFATMTSNSVTPTVRQQDGWIKLDICLRGGKRLVQKAGSLSVIATPNPVSETLHLQAEVFERGLHRVEMTSVTGQKVFEEEWHNVPGDAVHISVLNSSALAAGTYQVKLTTPTRSRFITVSVIH